MKKKTPKSVREAQDRYRKNKIEQVSVSLPKGTKEKICSVSEESLNKYINELIAKDLVENKSKVMAGIRLRIRRDMSECETVDDWKNAYRRLLDDLKATISGEAAFEKYVADLLGRPAMERFLSGVRAPLFSDDVIEQAEYVLEKGFSKCAVLDLPDKNDDAATRMYAKLAATPEMQARFDYRWLSHLFMITNQRCADIENNITEMLGAEAFNRLVLQGQYDAEKLWSKIARCALGTPLHAKFFVDYIAGEGVFTPKDFLSPKEHNDGWIRDRLPDRSNMYFCLLFDGDTIPMFFDMNTGAWINCRRDCRLMVDGWREFDEALLKAMQKENARRRKKASK